MVEKKVADETQWKNNNKYMIDSRQITNTEIFAFIAALVFKLSSRKVLFINRKDNRNY